jgi:hypothetical protein
MKKWRNKQKIFVNTMFCLFCIAILVFLLNAPKETTVKLPHTAQHDRFHAMKSKKQAEKFCGECHSQNGQAPLPENHPPKFRCLFCHKSR